MEPRQQVAEAEPVPAAPVRAPLAAPGRWVKKKRARRFVGFLPWAGGLLLVLGGLYWLFSPMPTTRVSLDLYVSALEWESADQPGKDLDWFGLSIAANDSVDFNLPPARSTSNPTGVGFDSTDFLTLRPAPPYRSVRVSKVAFPPQARIRLAQLAGNRLRLAVSAGPPAAGAGPLSWHLSLGQRLYDNPRTGRPQLLDCADAANDIPCEVDMRKTLGPSGSYAFDFTHPHPWASPARLLARQLSFQETNTAGTEAISSVLDGAVRLLDTNDGPLKLGERDVVRVTFTGPVELFVKSTPRNLVVHVDGVASQVVCGPKIMADEKGSDQRPLIIKHYYDQSPYTWAWAIVLVPLLLSFLAKKALAKLKTLVKRTLLILPLGLLSGYGARAQAVALARQYAAAVVSLNATQASGGSEQGSGFVVGSTRDSVYIVTAGHVLQEAGAVVKVKLEGIASELLAKVLFFNHTPPEDLALLAVAAPRFRWTPCATYDGLTPDDNLCFLHSPQVVPGRDDEAPTSDKVLLPLTTEAAMLTANSRTHTVQFVLVGIGPGDSGSALLLATAPPRVVGMITRAGPPHTAIDIAHIKHVLLPRLGDKWQLSELQPKTE